MIKSLHRPGLTSPYGLRRAKVDFLSLRSTFCIINLWGREGPAWDAGFQIDFISNFGNSIVRGLSFYSLIWFLYTIFYFIVKMHLISFLIHFIIMLIAVCLFGAYLMGWSRPAHFLFLIKFSCIYAMLKRYFQSVSWIYNI